MVDWLACEEAGLTPGQKSLMTRARQVLDWPAAQLMTLSLAIATDFDSVFIAWKRYHRITSYNVCYTKLLRICHRLEIEAQAAPRHP